MSRERTRRWTRVLILLSVIVLLSGCGLIKTRTILVPSGEPVQLAETVKAYIYVMVEGKREKSENRVEISEGWWCLPDPGDRP